MKSSRWWTANRISFYWIRAGQWHLMRPEKEKTGDSNSRQQGRQNLKMFNFLPFSAIAIYNQMFGSPGNTLLRLKSTLRSFSATAHGVAWPVKSRYLHSNCLCMLRYCRTGWAHVSLFCFSCRLHFRHRAHTRWSCVFTSPWLKDRILNLTGAPPCCSQSTTLRIPYEFWMRLEPQSQNCEWKMLLTRVLWRHRTAAGLKG